MKAALNWVLCTAESMGALIILWNGVPIHQRLLMGSTAEQASPRVFVLGAVAVSLSRALTGSDYGAFLRFDSSDSWYWVTQFSFWDA